ncbi:nucleoside-diphosphate kinase [candidate division KSB3 bacterium]|uniref:Nucleoside diphosphate kinase n=1 Tax=candidate division KSB3 bacterium TaxID=2044937 RepID=A0A2G6KI36_9BACT|nr:MAG: nucleoside-diphosphate kinase [candidate division KSB3 bacterium]
MYERTLLIIKPDAVKRELIGNILLRFERDRLHILAMKMTRLARHDAEEFYGEHRGKPYFEPLVEMLDDSPIVPVVFSGEDAIARVRNIIGATDPHKAAEGTIRHDFALDVCRNSVHASDSHESARREIAFFFSEIEMGHAPEMIPLDDVSP